MSRRPMPITGAENAPAIPRGQRGSLLLVALLLVVLVAAIAVGAASLVGSGAATGADRVLGEKALFAAQSGILRISEGGLSCDEAPSGAGEGAWFYCTPPGDAGCGGDNRSRVRGWAGAEVEEDAPAVHNICVNLAAAGGAGPPSECAEDHEDAGEWDCAFDDDDIDPGQGGATFQNMYVGDNVRLTGVGNWTIEGEVCLANGVSLQGTPDFRGNVYWESAEDTSGQARDYDACVYVAGALDEDLSSDDCDGESTLDAWCPHAEEGGSGWGYSD
ncbi:hypothetical protein D893_02487 [Thioalkalivibrio sp. ALE21]|nr:hypothetical protein D893_02487 [Thioalkalivibrio sp. ALE21]